MECEGSFFLNVFSLGKKNSANNYSRPKGRGQEMSGGGEKEEDERRN